MQQSLSHSQTYLLAISVLDIPVYSGSDEKFTCYFVMRWISHMIDLNLQAVYVSLQNTECYQNRSQVKINARGEIIASM